MSLNKVMLIGNLGKDPELRFTPSGRAVAKFSLATSEQWTTPEGQRQDRTEWHNIVVWGKQAETCGQYLSKGRQVFIEGSIRKREYDDKDGNRRFVTEIIARDVRFLGGGGGGGRKEAASSDSFSAPMGEDAPSGGGGGGPSDDDIPF
jgi:single-strand DNA-binding protein